MYLGCYFETVEIPQSERRQKLSQRLQNSDEYVCYAKVFRRTNPSIPQKLKLIKQTAICIKTTSARTTAYKIEASIMYGENRYKLSAQLFLGLFG